MNSATLTIGLLNGLTIGLLAVGLVLVYKANRFINLAHAQFGALPAVILAKAVNEWGLAFWIAFLLVVGLGSVIAIASERFLVRPVRAASNSPLRLLLLTVGLSQLLLAMTYVPALIPDANRPMPYPQPFTASWTIDGFRLQGMDILTFVVIPLSVGALAAFLRYSTTGKQIRAAASDADSARLCGISVTRVGIVTWGLAGGLAAISAVLAAPHQPAFQAAALGPALLLSTLGAAALGAFVSIPVAFAGGLLIGILGQIVVGVTSSSSNGQLATFLLILFFIAIRAKPIAAVFAQSGGEVSERSVTRVPEAKRDLFVVRNQRRLLVGAGLFLAVSAPWLPGLTAEGQRFKLALVIVFCLLGVSLTMLVGWAGQISMGHFAIVGLGAFVTGRLVPQGISLPVIVVVAALAGALLLVVTGLPALRVPGFTLAVATLGVAVVAPVWLFRQEWLGTDRPTAVSIDTPLLPRHLGAVSDQLGTYYFALGVLVLGLLAASSLQRSVPGRLVVAVRDNERRVAAFGIAPSSIKLAVLGVSGSLAGAAGVLWAVSYRVANVNEFTPELSIALLAIPVIGGLGSLAGAVAATLVLYVPVYFLAPHLEGLMGEFSRTIGFLLLFGGLGQVLVIRQLPGGIAGLAQSVWQRWLTELSDLTDSSSSMQPQPEAIPDPLPSAPAEHPLAVTRQLHRLLGPGDDRADSLVAEDVRVNFGGIVALDGASIRVSPGEIVGLIGPNGAGKTTLMNVVAGALAAQDGSVHLGGHDVTDLPPDLRAAFGLARTFQDGTLFEGLTIRETVQVALSRHWMVSFSSAMVGAPWARYADAATEQTADTILARFGLGQWADALGSEVSTGTRRISDLACQMAFSPSIILLDEPTGGVAQREAEAFGPLLRRLSAELECSVLIIEHDMPLLMTVCDRVYAMDQGRIIAEGQPEDIRHDPHVIASYLGTNAAAVNRSGAQLVGGAA